MKICPYDRCRLCPAKYGKEGRMLKGNCYNRPDPRCLVGLIDIALTYLGLTVDAILTRIRRP